MKIIQASTNDHEQALHIFKSKIIPVILRLVFNLTFHLSLLLLRNNVYLF